MPHWKGWDIGDIGRPEIKTRLRAVLQRNAPYTANKMLIWTRMLFNFAADEGLIAANPAAGMKAPFKPPPGGRNRVLSDAELVEVWERAGEFPYPYGPFIQLAILIPSRRGEIAGMNVREFDRTSGIWWVPEERAKNQKELALPLPPAAWDLIENLPKNKSGLLFTCNGKAPLAGFSRFKKLLDEKLENVAPWRQHDLRRTTATGMAKLGIDEKITELCLNHVPRELRGVRAVYNKHDYLLEKTEALGRWADYVLALVAAADAENVVPLKAKETARIG